MNPQILTILISWVGFVSMMGGIATLFGIGWALLLGGAVLFIAGGLGPRSAK